MSFLSTIDQDGTLNKQKRHLVIITGSLSKAIGLRLQRVFWAGQKSRGENVATWGKDVALIRDQTELLGRRGICHSTFGHERELEFLLNR